MTTREFFGLLAVSVPEGSTATFEGHIGKGDLVVIEVTRRTSYEALVAMKQSIESLLAQTGARVVVLTEGVNLRVDRGNS